VKERERGYNQSDYIAMGLSNILNIDWRNDIVKRELYTISQTLLESRQRKTNVENVFKIKKENQVANKTILLIDDVLTTGSTLNNCANTLLQAKAKRVDIATLLIPHIV
jgi:ComF family protein